MDGFSMLEVLVSLVILSSGLLTLLHFQLKLPMILNEVNCHDIAMFQGLSLLERLRANEHVPFREKEIAAWQFELKQLLPEGYAVVSCAQQHCAISISWRLREKQWLQLDANL